MTKARSIKAVFDLLISKYSLDTDLQNWCQTNFTCEPDIQAGQDDENLPKMLTDVSIRIIPGSRGRTRGMSKRSHGLTIIGIVKSLGFRKAEGPEESEGWRVLKGLEHIDELMSLLEEITIPAIQAEGIAITPFDGAPDAIIHPYSRGELSYQIEIPSTLK